MIANRPNGLMVVNLEGGKRKFVTSRKHQFTPLESISIYTVKDSVPLEEIFTTMHEKLATLPPPEPKASSAEAETYFKEILPEYDPYRVHTKDIKKVVKWFNAMNTAGLITEAAETKKEEKPSSEEEE